MPSRQAPAQSSLRIFLQGAHLPSLALGILVVGVLLLWWYEGNCKDATILARISAAAADTGGASRPLWAIGVGVSLILLVLLQWPTFSEYLRSNRSFETPWLGLGDDVETAGAFESALRFAALALTVLLFVGLLFLTSQVVPKDSCPKEPEPPPIKTPTPVPPSPDPLPTYDGNSNLDGIERQFRALNERLEKLPTRDPSDVWRQIAQTLQQTDRDLQLLTSTLRQPVHIEALNEDLNHIAGEIKASAESASTGSTSISDRLGALTTPKFSAAFAEALDRVAGEIKRSGESASAGSASISDRLGALTTPKFSATFADGFDRVAGEIKRSAESASAGSASISERLAALSKAKVEVALDQDSLSPFVSIAGAIPAGVIEIGKKLDQLPERWPPPPTTAKLEERLAELTSVLKSLSDERTSAAVDGVAAKLGAIQTLIQSWRQTGHTENGAGTDLDEHIAVLTETLRAIGQDTSREATAMTAAATSLLEIEGKLDKLSPRPPSEGSSPSTFICEEPTVSPPALPPPWTPPRPRTIGVRRVCRPCRAARVERRRRASATQRNRVGEERNCNRPHQGDGHAGQ